MSMKQKLTMSSLNHLSCLNWVIIAAVITTELFFIRIDRTQASPPASRTASPADKHARGSMEFGCFVD
jgi:hypothetical protein